MKKDYLSGNVEDLELILNLSFDLITITDSKGKFITASKSCENLFGISEDLLVGMTPDDLEREKIFNHSITRKVLDEKKKVTMVQNTASGKVLLATAYPIFKNNKLHKIITFSKDITEEKKLSDELDNLMNELEWYKTEYKNRQTELKVPPVLESDSMRRVLQMVRHVSDMNVTVLLLGETGVGKGYIASIIHNTSNRKDNPFITVNCGAIPKELLESELFGYDEGAFTGAKKGGKKGLFEIASKGTLFLDEIGEMPLDLQVKLLHVLDSKSIIHVGGEKKINVDARIIAATNKDLKEAVKEGSFREDLFYRLNVLPITIPPLSERKADIPGLINLFLEKFNDEYNTNKKISKEGYVILKNRNYPGNVRELENTIERLVVTSIDEVITEEKINSMAGTQTKAPDEIPEGKTLKEVMDEYEKTLLLAALKKYHTMREAGKALGIDQSTISKKLKRLGIRVE